MGLGQAVRSCLAKYADFRGRAARSEYWYWTLSVSLMYLAGFIAMGAADVLLGGNSAAIAFAILAVLVLLVVLLPSLAVAIRRLHDTNSSGWWYLLALVPYLGSLVLLIWFCLKGTEGENRFGSDPLQPDVTEAFS